MEFNGGAMETETPTECHSYCNRQFNDPSISAFNPSITLSGVRALRIAVDCSIDGLMKWSG